MKKAGAEETIRVCGGVKTPAFDIKEAQKGHAKQMEDMDDFGMYISDLAKKKGIKTERERFDDITEQSKRLPPPPEDASADEWEEYTNYRMAMDAQANADPDLEDYEMFLRYLAEQSGEDVEKVRADLQTKSEAELGFDPFAEHLYWQHEIKGKRKSNHTIDDFKDRFDSPIGITVNKPLKTKKK